MTGKIGVALVALAAPALGGCVAQAALAAAELAQYVPEPQRPSNAHLKPAATKACSERAAQYGAVHVIDVEQRSVGRIVVWGTVTDARERRSFECHFTSTIADFKLRQIRARP
jgi:hypothetical protein